MKVPELVTHLISTKNIENSDVLLACEDICFEIEGISQFHIKTDVVVRLKQLNGFTPKQVDMVINDKKQLYRALNSLLNVVDFQMADAWGICVQRDFAQQVLDESKGVLPNV